MSHHLDIAEFYELIHDGEWKTLWSAYEYAVKESECTCSPKNLEHLNFLFKCEELIMSSLDSEDARDFILEAIELARKRI